MEKVAFFPPFGDYLSSSIFITRCKNLIMKDKRRVLCLIQRFSKIMFQSLHYSQIVFFLKHLNISLVGFIYLYMCNNNLLFFKNRKDRC